MGDTEESHNIQMIRVQKLMAGESPDKFALTNPLNSDELINEPNKELEQFPFTPNNSRPGMGKANREPTKAEMFQMLGKGDHKEKKSSATENDKNQSALALTS